MSLTLEIDANGVRVVDTAGTTGTPIDITQALAIVAEGHQRAITIATGVNNRVIDLGSITAVKVLLIKTDSAGVVQVAVNGSATPIPVKNVLLIVESGGTITSATISNSSGQTVTYEVHVFG